MHLIRGLYNLKKQHRGCVLTIGNFDGLHLGHQTLLKKLSETASELNCPSCLMTFEPLPSEFFDPDNARSRLMNSREKIKMLNSLSDEICPDSYLLMKFNQQLSNMTADAFIQEILVNALEVKAVIIGDDFRFGSDRSGDFEMLQLAGKKHNFDVIALSTHHIDDMRVSSTRIRQSLESGDFKNVQNMMNRPYSICGKVSHGDKRGRTIGFPTANIRLHRLKSPIHGVYSVTMHSEKLGNIHGVANIGKRPTVNGENFQLEVHLFDFDKDIYGENVCISFNKKIRSEKKFDSFEALKEQITLDCQTAKNLL